MLTIRIAGHTNAHRNRISGHAIEIKLKRSALTSGTGMDVLVGTIIPRMMIEMLTRNMYEAKQVINSMSPTLNRAGILAASGEMKNGINQCSRTYRSRTQIERRLNVCYKCIGPLPFTL